MQKAAKEEDGDEPYTISAECKLEVERELAKIAQLNYVILRPAVTYGIGDRVGLSM